MIPHLPTIITDKYTIEAWVRPSKVGPMNIVCRSDESYPMATWSHQLRINAEGQFEHYVEADEKYTVSHTATVEQNRKLVADLATVQGAEAELKSCRAELANTRASLKKESAKSAALEDQVSQLEEGRRDVRKGGAERGQLVAQLRAEI